MLKTSRLHHARGFTLVELMIGLIITAILLAAAMPGYTIWIQNSRIRTTAESISSGLMLARAEAVSRNATVQMVLGSGSSWVVGCPTVTAGCPAVIQSRATGDGSSATVTVVSASGTTIQFNNLGRMSLPVPAAGWRITINVDNSALTPAQSRDLSITVDVGGNIKLCDPNISVATDSRSC